MVKSLVMRSEQDPSINFILPTKNGGMFEARYVRRAEDYFVVYLSSQTGCQQFCRMCHLTATGQTLSTDASKDDYLDQAQMVLQAYDELRMPAQSVHFNFMARGEVFANLNFLNDPANVLTSLADKAIQRSLVPRFLLSTIMPRSIGDIDLLKLFPVIQPEIYYSIYSMDPSFRKRWLPNAQTPEAALSILRAYYNGRANLDTKVAKNKLD